jgi:hypothetical protein
MASYEEEHKTIDVPQGTGVPGLLKAVGAVLELPRVQNINIDKDGKVSYRRFRKPEEPEQNLAMDFDTIMPWQIVRTHLVTEVAIVSINAAVVLGQLFSLASMEGYNPVALVVSPSTKLWVWYTSTTKLVTNREDLHGLPVFFDQQVPEEALIMCVAYGRRAAMVDVVKSYKVSIPQQRSKVHE